MNYLMSLLNDQIPPMRNIMKEFLTVKVIKTEACFNNGSESFKISRLYLDEIIRSLKLLEMISNVEGGQRKGVSVSSLTIKNE